MRKEKQIVNNQTMTTQSKTFNESKNKSKPRNSSMQKKNFLLNSQANEKHQTLNSQPITGS
jgi:hypothetical protein